jgi:hypothetical protein
MLDLKGNTAVYMLYAHARIAGIIRKGKKDVAEVAKTAHISLDHASEVRAAATCTKCRAIQGQQFPDPYCPVCGCPMHPR